MPQGIKVVGAINSDWEDIAHAPGGRLLIADTGNNANKRRDLMLYLIEEPDPLAGRVWVEQEIPVYYPEQKAFPPSHNNFDCEAVFCRDEAIYFVTKHRADNNATLYKLPWSVLDSEPADPRGYPLQMLGLYGLRGMVTAADSSPDGKVVILTYGGIWLFENQDGIVPLGGPVRWLPIRAKQCEAICFVDEQTLLVTNEQRTLYRVSIDSMHLIKE